MWFELLGKADISISNMVGGPEGNKEVQQSFTQKYSPFYLWKLSTCKSLKQNMLYVWEGLWFMDMGGISTENTA